jgi:hypothetical protein
MSSRTPILPADFTSEEDSLPPEGGLTICATADERPKLPPPTRARSWRGNIAESKFESDAMAVGFHVARPASDCVPYDRLIIAPGDIYKVQVRSTAGEKSDGTGRGWILNLLHYGGCYTRGDFDFLAALIPGDTWFIIPFHLIEGLANITLPRGQHSKRPNRFQAYREAWHLFQ